MTTKIALLDLDGTVADYDGAMSRALDALKDPSEPEYRHIAHSGFPAWIEARRRLVSMQPGFWRNLPRLPLGFSVVDALDTLGFDVTVLSKGPETKPLAWSEKMEWCREHLPGKRVTITEDKSNTYGRVLVDDWPAYFMGWLRHRPRGIVIVPAQPWNVDAESLSPNIYRYDGTNPTTLLRILEAVANRKAEEVIDLPRIRASIR